MRTVGPRTWGCAILACMGFVAAANAQVALEDWVVFEDTLTNSACGAVNAVNATFIVIDRTGEMVLVDGEDAFYPELFVDESNEVFFNGFSAGFIAFADDGDGLPAAFWLTDLETVVEVDLATGEPFDSQLLPGDVVDTACDACDFVDDQSFCGGGGGGVIVDPGTGGGPITIACGAGAAPAGLVTLGLLPLCGWGRRRLGRTRA